MTVQGMVVSMCGGQLWTLKVANQLPTFALLKASSQCDAGLMIYDENLRCSGVEWSSGSIVFSGSLHKCSALTGIKAGGNVKFVGKSIESRPAIE